MRRLTVTVILKADLSSSDMEDTVIFHTSFKNANLSKALIDTEHVLESDFTGANLKHTILMIQILLNVTSKTKLKPSKI